ncbi:MAG: hypothetical protein ACPGR3_02695, partial [Ilumatobacteraceae bacterium]
MSATSVILIAVIALVVLAGASFATLARRSDVRGAGALSDETVARDRAEIELVLDVLLGERLEGVGEPHDVAALARERFSLGGRH